MDGGGNTYVTGDTNSTDFPTTEAALQTTGSGTFIPRAAQLGIETLLTPVQAPKANAIAERLVGTLRRECLDHLIIKERRLRLVLKEYSPLQSGRPHRSLGLVPPNGPPIRLVAPDSGRVKAAPSTQWFTS